jgi:hypothetical protein
MARILAAHGGPVEQSRVGPGVSTEPILLLAKINIRRMLDILEHVGNLAPEMQKTRTDVLRSAFEDIRW